MKKITTVIAVTLGLISFFIFTGYRHAGVSSEFISHVSIYPGAEIISSQHITETNNVVLDVNSTVADICEFYKNEMTKNGWTIITNRANFIAFSKDNKGVMIDLESVLQKKSRVTISYLTNV